MDPVLPQAIAVKTEVTQRGGGGRRKTRASHRAWYTFLTQE